MKPKPAALLLLLAALIIAAALGWIVVRIQRGAALHPGAVTAGEPASPMPLVAIQDGKTIDFSSGKPVVKNDEDEKAIIAAAVKEMDAASKGVIFSPTPPSPGGQKTAEPAGNPSKP
jgi:hypothetical protein